MSRQRRVSRSTPAARRVGGDRGAVDRADRGAEHEVRARSRAPAARAASRPRARRAARHRRRGRRRRCSALRGTARDQPSRRAGGGDDVAVGAAARVRRAARRGVGGRDDVCAAGRARDDGDRHGDRAQLAPRRRPAQLAGVVGEEAERRGARARRAATSARSAIHAWIASPGPPSRSACSSSVRSSASACVADGHEREQRRVGEHRGARELRPAHEQLEHDERAEAVADEHGGRGVERASARAAASSACSWIVVAA